MSATPPALRDLATPSEVHDLVTRFYLEIALDELLEPVFGDVAEVDWVEHIPKLIDYWCWILFGTGGNPASVAKVHRHLHEKAPIGPEHCDRWFVLWAATIDSGWTGPHADHAKGHAESLMTSMAKHLFGFAWTAPAPATALTDGTASTAARPS
jgi:hemoglobin